MNVRSRALRVAAGSLATAFVAVMVLWPLAAILRRGFVADGALDLAPVIDTFASDRARSVVRFTFLQAALSTLATVAIGVPAAWSVARAWPGRGAVQALTAAAFVLPTVVMGLAWRAIFERGLLAIVVAHSAFNVAIIVQILGAAWSRVDAAPSDAARTLGASRIRAWWTIDRPRLVPPFVGATLLAFLFSFTSFGVIVVLGTARQSTIETEIARLSRGLQFDRAGVLALLQLSVVLLVTIVAARFESGTTPERDAVVRRARSSVRAAAAAPAVALAVTPLAVLVGRVGFDDGHPTMAGLRSLADSDLPMVGTPLGALGQSARISLVTVTIAVLVAGAAVVATTSGSRRARLLDAVVLLPLGVSAVTLGYGYLITFDEAPLRLRDYWWVVPLAHAAVAIPFVVRVLRPARRTLDPRLHEVAATLGAAPIARARTITIPVLRPAIGVAMGFAAAISLGEFGATSMLGRRNEPTAPIAIDQLLGRPGDRPRRAADALALLLAVSAILVMAAATRTRVRRRPVS